MEWTSTAPTAPGWYWYQTAHGYSAEAVKVAERRGALEVIGGMRPDQYIGWWAGPIEPAPPQTAAMRGGLDA